MNDKSGDYRMTLRMPREVYLKLRQIAKEENRSLTAQIVYALQQWLKTREEEK